MECTLGMLSLKTIYIYLCNYNLYSVNINLCFLFTVAFFLLTDRTVYQIAIESHCGLVADALQKMQIRSKQHTIKLAPVVAFEV